jgi:hypothetical protein
MKRVMNRSYRIRRHHSFSWVWTFFLVILGLGLFAYGIYVLRFAKRDNIVESQSLVEKSRVFISPENKNDSVRTEIHLFDVSGGSSSGTMERQWKDHRMSYRLSATLPVIDAEKNTYEAWLVQKAPFDFFSLGELTMNEDGIWMREWNGEEEKEYETYETVIVTLESKDENPAPSSHVLEGVFDEKEKFSEKKFVPLSDEGSVGTVAD